MWHQMGMTVTSNNITVIDNYLRSLSFEGVNLLTNFINLGIADVCKVDEDSCFVENMMFSKMLVAQYFHKFDYHGLSQKPLNFGTFYFGVFHYKL